MPLPCVADSWCVSSRGSEFEAAVRVSMNIRSIEGSYGGGNRFAAALERHLQDAGHEVLRELAPDFDVILIVSSKPNLTTTAYTDEDVVRYLARSPHTVVVHRINTSDEPRGRDLGNNRAMLRVNKIADHTVYVSEYVKRLFLDHGIDADKPSTVILNAAGRGALSSARPRRLAARRKAPAGHPPLVRQPAQGVRHLRAPRLDAGRAFLAGPFRVHLHRQSAGGLEV